MLPHVELRDRRRPAGATVARRHSARRAPVLDQRVERTVTSEPAGGEHARMSQPARQEPVGDVGELRTVAGQVEQRRGCGPADGRDEQVALDALSGANRDSSNAAVGATTAALGLHDLVAESGIEDANDLDSGATEVVDGCVSFLVGGQDHRPLSRSNRPEVDEPADGRRQQHTGLVVALEHVRALDESRRDDEPLGADLEEALEHGARLALEDGQPVVVVAPGDDAVRDDLDVRPCGERLTQLGERRELGRSAVAQVAAEPVLLLDEQHPRPGLGGGDRGRHACRSASGHAHVDVGVALLEAVLGWLVGDPPAGGEAAEHLLVRRPQPLRLDERLVVEAGAEEPPDELVGGLHVVLQ